MSSLSDMDFFNKVLDHVGGVNALARKMGNSPATWSTVKTGTYKFNLEKLIGRLRKAFPELENESELVQCPAIGDIHPDVCRKYADAAHEGRNLSDRIYSIVRKHCETCPRGKR